MHPRVQRVVLMSVIAIVLVAACSGDRLVTPSAPARPQLDSLQVALLPMGRLNVVPANVNICERSVAERDADGKFLRWQLVERKAEDWT